MRRSRSSRGRLATVRRVPASERGGVGFLDGVRAGAGPVAALARPEVPFWLAARLAADGLGRAAFFRPAADSLRAVEPPRAAERERRGDVFLAGRRAAVRLRLAAARAGRDALRVRLPERACLRFAIGSPPSSEP